jgi:ElaB/YqjD/DUF883 family membrane-anchored ribosome-binding protein
MATNTSAQPRNNPNPMGSDEEEISIQRAVGEGLRQAKDNFQQVQKAVGKEAKVAYQKSQEIFIDKAKEASEKAAEALKRTSEYVSQNPWTALGICAAFGFLVGMLVSPRRD